jgi:5'-nucleotidase
MNRRAFVGLAGLTSLGALTSSFELRSSAQRKGKKLTILHTNDTHSNIDPFPLNHAKYPGMGGVGKRAALIEQIRKEEEHVILVDSGDIFQGTPYFNRYHGELEMKLMSAMQYDVATMGNHDFDIGMEGFKKAQRFSNFPFVCSNYDFRNTTLENQTLPYHILRRGGIKIGFFGIGVNLEGLSPSSCWNGMNYIDPIEQANSMAQLLSDLGCDLVVCLSHLGFEYSSSQVSDKLLAAETANIHLILGGHTHTFMEKPLIMENANKKPVLINQTGWAGLFLGRIDIDFQRGTFKHQALLVQ